jgi:outer membrane receptor protein involved in Fe transport
MLDVGKMVDAVLDAVDKPLRTLAERVKAVEAATLPADLVAQLKSAAEALAEPMPEPSVVAPVTPALPQEIPRSVTGTVITRTGELAVSYSDGGGERLGHVIGPQGEKGVIGERGEPGRDGIGIKGDEGPPGRDGISVTAASINRDGELMLTLSDGSVLTPGRVVAPDKKRV